MIVLTVRSPDYEPSRRYCAMALRDKTPALTDAHGEGPDAYSAMANLAENLHKVAVELRTQTN